MRLEDPLAAIVPEPDSLHGGWCVHDWPRELVVQHLKERMMHGRVRVHSEHLPHHQCNSHS